MGLVVLLAIAVNNKFQSFKLGDYMISSFLSENQV